MNRAYKPFGKGFFIQVKPWGAIKQVAARTGKDSGGEYAVLPNGGKIRKPAVECLTGIVINDTGVWKEIRLADGTVVSLHPSVMTPLIYRYGKFKPYRRTPDPVRMKQRTWREYMKDTLVHK